MVARVRHTQGMDLPTLRDGDLVLRPKRAEDADAITAACQDPEIPRWTLVPSLAGWAREELGLNRIEILPHRDNAPSRRVAEKAGLRDTGELKPCPRAASDDPVYAVFAWSAS